MGRCLTIILAAGEGTRMKSDLAKVLHPIAGLPMVGHVIDAAVAAGTDDLAVVIGPDRDDVADLVKTRASQAQIYVQTQRRGTAHAVLSAQSAWEVPVDEVLVLFGDTPLIRPNMLDEVRDDIAEGAAIVVVGFEAANPHGYGRLIKQDGKLTAIREEKDASDDERSITFCNSGIMGFSGRHLAQILAAIGTDNAQGEYYLTDAVAIANDMGLSVVARAAPSDDVMGINDRVQLADCEAIYQDRRRQEIMRAGATMTAPDTVFVSHDTQIGRDVVIEPNVWIGPGVSVGDHVTIRFGSHLEGATVEDNATVGPYARLRPGAHVMDGARVGNFVEVKNATIEPGAKVNHLTYIGDARVGAKANIGAGTITCNYDGFNKAKTDIGEGAFIGSNSALVAPVKIGKGAYVASGSVITSDVEAGALAIGRGRQVEKSGWVNDFHKSQKRRKPD